MADLFDMNIGGLGWHIPTALVALTALIIACFAITGYISFRDNSIDPNALKDGDIPGSNPTFTSVTIGANTINDFALVFPLTENIEGTLSTLNQVTTPLRDIAMYSYYFDSFDLPNLTAAQASLFMTNTSTVRRVDISTASQTFTATDQTNLFRGSVPTGGVIMTPGAALGANNEILIIFESDVPLAGNLVLQLEQNNDQFDSTGVEVIFSGNNNRSYTRGTVTANDGADQMTIAPTGAPVIKAGSYIYMNAEQGANLVIAKGCINVTGGTVAVTV